MKQFDTIKNNKIWEDKSSIECIDYSILLTKVFGKPIDSSKAFMYLFRRYGFPNTGSDSYKDLCAYTFHTNDKEIIVRWRIGVGDYHYHLCAFAPRKTMFEIETELRKPYRDWHDRCREWAKSSKGFDIYYDLFDVFKEKENEDGTSNFDFVGTPEQEAEISKYIAENHNGNYTDESWMALHSWKNSQNQQIIKEYEVIEPMPKYYREDFSCRFDDQLIAGEKQHEWILSLPKDSLIPRIYFAAMKLFESWKRSTYIRDAYFNMAGDEHGKRSVDYSRAAGYPIPEKLFNKEEYFDRFLEFTKKLK